MDEACRNQQLGEGWFPTFDDVPKEAVTLTITAIMNCKAISCVVPDERKAQAVYNTLVRGYQYLLSRLPYLGPIRKLSCFWIRHRHP